MIAFSNTIHQKWGHLLQYIYFYRTRKKYIAASSFLLIAQTLTLMPVPLVLQKIFDQALPHGDPKQLSMLLGLALLLFFANALLTLTNKRITLKVNKDVIYEIRKKLAVHLLYAGHLFFTTADLDAIHSNVVYNTERLDRMTNVLLSQSLPSTLMTIGLLCLLWYLNPLLFLIILAAMSLVYLTSRSVSKRIRIHIKKFHQDFAEFSKGTSFALTFSELITVSATEEIEITKQEIRLHNVRNSGQRMVWLSAIYSAIQSNVLIFSGLIVLFVGGLQIHYGTSTLGAMLSFYVTLNLLNNHAKVVIGGVPTLIEGLESLAASMPMLKEQYKLPTQSPQENQSFGSIVFENVYFDHRNAFNLANVTFSIHQGEAVGIFGASGSGKSTLIKLLLGFYTPKKGEIHIGGRNIADIDISTYRRSVGVLLQDPQLFPGTIRENLVYGLPDIQEADMIAICTICRIHPFISTLEKGYDTDIGNRSASISGGQKQRIAIARALLRKPQLLILDEPDNNLDEALIVAMLQEIQKMGITLIVISHNQALRSVVNRTILVANGTIRTEISN